MVTGLKNSLEQSRLMANLFGERANVLQKLAELDEKIDLASKGEVPQVVAPKAVKAKAVVAHVNGDAPKRGRGRPKGSKNKNNKEVAPPAVVPVVAVPVAPVAPEQPVQVAVQMPDGKKRFRNVDQNGHRVSLKELILTVCARHRNGIKLDELAKKIWESDYKSTSQGKQFVQNIRTNLHTLMNSGVIVKDDEKKYHKNEPAAVAAVEAPVAG